LIKEASGTFHAPVRRQHNGYYAGNFSRASHGARTPTGLPQARGPSPPPAPALRARSS